MLHRLFFHSWILGLFLTISYIRPSYQRNIESRQSDGLQWGPCVKPVEWGEESSLVCANFTVPLDWTNTTNGEKAVLYVAKLKARSGKSLGTIFMNPGGPGGTGYGLLREASSEQLSNITGGNFDLVSWDPRGVGLTNPAINCFEGAGNQTADQAALGFQQYLIVNTLNSRSSGPDQVDIDTFLGNTTNIENYMRAFIQKCVDKNQDNLKYVGAVATVKDLVALADAIEGPGSPIRYWGLSYGTFLGAHLLDLYPNRVGRVVLDGIVDATTFTQTPYYQYYGYAVQDADKALQIFYDACAAAGPDLCAIATSNSTSATVGQWVNDLIDTAYTGNVFGAANLLRAQLVQAARSPTAWPAFASQLAAAYRDLHPAAATNTSTTRRLRLRYFEPFALSKRQESDYPWATSLSSLYAIWCGDAADDTGGVNTTTVFNDLIRVTKEVTNVEGPFGVVYPSAFCQFWKTRAVERHFPQGPPMLANPIIIIGNTYDSLTPLASARKLVTRLNGVGTRQAALIQQDGSGHLSLQMNSVCTYSIIQRYFTDGVFPEDTLCGTNFNGFPQDPTTGNNSTSTSIISAPLASTSLGLHANEALARAPLTIFQIFILSIIGIFSGLLITL